MSKQITVYTTNNCAYCVMVKKYLSSKGHQYDEVNVELNPDRRQEVMDISGARTVPVTVITDGRGQKQVAIGPNYGLIASALA
ncbi:MAG TPA: glutaredoxin family protein [Candidatus Saccharimonadales bacterium]|jgi:glutaredoxin